MRVIFVLNLIFSLISTSLFAGNGEKKCNKAVYSKGWWRSYKYVHMDSSEITKKSDSSTISTYLWTEQSTAASDPGVSTGWSTSSTQGTSSWGDCAGWKVLFTQENRHQYIEQNIVQIKKQISQGMGGHLEALAFFSRCNQEVLPFFGQLLKKNYDKLAGSQVFNQNDEKLLAQRFDELLTSEPSLKMHCSPLLASEV